MWRDRVSNPGPLTYESGALLTALRGPATVSRASDSKARGPVFNYQSGSILLFPLLLIQEEQLSVTGKSMCN